MQDYQHLITWGLRGWFRWGGPTGRAVVAWVWAPRFQCQLLGAHSTSPSSADKETVICSKAGASDLLIPLWNGSRHTHQRPALLLQQGKLFILLKDGYLNLQKHFFPVSFNLSATAVSVTEQGLCVLLISSRGEGWGSRKEGRRKGRANHFPSAIPITPNCPALNVGSQMPCRAALRSPRAVRGWCAARSPCCSRAPAGLVESNPSVSITGSGPAQQ